MGADLAKLKVSHNLKQYAINSLRTHLIWKVILCFVSELERSSELCGCESRANVIWHRVGGPMRKRTLVI